MARVAGLAAGDRATRETAKNAARKAIPGHCRIPMPDVRARFIALGQCPGLVLKRPTTRVRDSGRGPSGVGGEGDYVVSTPNNSSICDFCGSSGLVLRYRSSQTEAGCDKPHLASTKPKSRCKWLWSGQRSISISRTAATSAKWLVLP